MAESSIGRIFKNPSDRVIALRSNVSSSTIFYTESFAFRLRFDSEMFVNLANFELNEIFVKNVE